MVQSRATSVNEYLASLPEDRRRELEAVRKVILDNLDPKIEEIMQYGMIGYAIPHSVYPKGYHCDPRQPLCYAGLASQKQHMSMYLMCTYGAGDVHDWFRAEWAKTGKKLDMGAACIRFKRAQDLALDVIAATLRRVTAAKYIALIESRLAESKTGKTHRTTAKTTKKTAAKAPAKVSAKAPAKTAAKEKTAAGAKAARATAEGTARKATSATRVATTAKKVAKATVKAVAKATVKATAKPAVAGAAPKKSARKAHAAR